MQTATITLSQYGGLLFWGGYIMMMVWLLLAMNDHQHKFDQLRHLSAWAASAFFLTILITH